MPIGAVIPNKLIHLSIKFGNCKLIMIGLEEDIHLNLLTFREWFPFKIPNLSSFQTDSIIQYTTHSIICLSFPIHLIFSFLYNVKSGFQVTLWDTQNPDWLFHWPIFLSQMMNGTTKQPLFFISVLTFVFTKQK